MWLVSSVNICCKYKQTDLVKLLCPHGAKTGNVSCNVEMWRRQSLSLSAQINLQTISIKCIYCNHKTADQLLLRVFIFSERAFSPLLRISHFIALLMSNPPFFQSVIIFSRTLKPISSSGSKSSRRIVLRTNEITSAINKTHNGMKTYQSHYNCT